jgi:hypothetical protein
MFAWRTGSVAHVRRPEAAASDGQGTLHGTNGARLIQCFAPESFEEGSGALFVQQ